MLFSATRGQAGLSGWPTSAGWLGLKGTIVLLWLLLMLGQFGVDRGLGPIALDILVLLVGPVALTLLVGTQGQGLRSKLRRSQQQLKVMATSADALAWTCDAQGNITYAGDLLTAHYGYGPSEVAGLNLRDLVHPQEVERLDRVLKAGVGWDHARWRSITKDGSERWFAGSAVPERAPDGAVLGYTGSTQRLSGEAIDEQRLRALADSIRDRLDSRAIQAVFQPILSVDTGRLIGAEALSRFPGSDRTPEQWFTGAAEVGLHVELDLAAVRIALTAAADALPEDIYLSVNVSPLTLTRTALLDLLTGSRIRADRIVVEVTEHASITNYDAILPAVEALREAGVRLAIDDAGAGYASFRHILRLAPEYIKLDRSLISGIDSDPAKRALAGAVVMFGLEMHSVIVAEGVETPAELRCAQTLGIDAVQGYLFGRPAADWTTWNAWHRRGPLYSVTAANASAQNPGDQIVIDGVRQP